MPRYTKGSFEESVYHQILDEASDDTPSAYVNPDGKDTGIFAGTTGISYGDRLRAIKNMCRTHELGWVTDQHAVEIIGNISRGV
jgi:hypothetical protein